MQDLDSFLSQLNEDASNWAPVSFRTTSKLDLKALPLTRYAESTRYRSAQYNCYSFRKPISRVLQAIPRAEKNDAIETVRTRPVKSATPVTDEQIFLLFACCVPVIGARRSTICDLQRGTFQLIPNGLAEILRQHKGKSIAAIKDAYKHQYDDQIERYFEFLIDLEFGFWCDGDDVEAFSEIDFAWDAPELITNAIIDADERSEHNFGVILRDLDDLGCKALQVRFYSGGGILQLRELLTDANGTCLRSIELITPFQIEDTDQDYTRMCIDFPRVSRLVIHSAPEDRELRIEQSRTPLIYRRMVVDSPSCCGEVHPAYFVSQISTFSEAQTYNTCLNKKISIDTRGEIRNCPSLPYSFGNIRDTSLHSALAHSNFKQLWTLNKDQVQVCKDCEFRYICVDCRAYISRPEDRFSKPAKCTYDPYSAQWR